MTDVALSPASASMLFGTIEAALVLSCLRTHGERLTQLIELEVAQREHHLRIVDPLPTESATPANRAALAQRSLDRCRGADSDVGIDAMGRVWLRYPPPHWFGVGLHAPSVALAAIPPSVSRAWFRGQHGLSAARYGGPSIAFVHTHDMCDGDELDAGYFVDLARNVPEHDRYTRVRGLDLPSADAITSVDALPVVADQLSAWQRVAMRTAVLRDLLGPVGAVATVEHAWRIALGGLHQWLPGGFGVAPPAGPMDAAQLWAVILRTAGATVCVEAGGAGEGAGRAVLHHGPLPGPDGDLLPSFVGALHRAWSAVLPNYVWELRAVVEPSARSADPTTVLFDLLGPLG